MEFYLTIEKEKMPNERAFWLFHLFYRKKKNKKIKNIRIYSCLLVLIIAGTTLTGCHTKQSEYQSEPYRAQMRNGVCYDENGNIISLEEFIEKFYHDENGKPISIEEFKEMHKIDSQKTKNK